VSVPPSTVHRAAPPPPSTAAALRAYFYSGWAFLIPYLVVYLLYYWQKWPANSFAPSALGNGGYIPALLHVYWALHAIHLALAAIALRSWWRDASQDSEFRVSSTKFGTAYSLLATRYSLLGRLAPWVLLTLIFAIPGVYLEWPSDPWEHLSRITEWATHDVVANHSAGYKSFYFFAYSWVGWLSPPYLMPCLNVYYTGACLLLAWQYYLLGKAVGLDRRWAFLSVIVNVLTFGNVCFSFYRYYSLASTVFAQMGAVALTRIALEYATSIRWKAKNKAGAVAQSTKGNGSRAASTAHRPQSTDLPSPRGFVAPYSRFNTQYSLLRLAAASATLFALIAFSHVQGLGITGLSIAAIVVWRLIQWKRSAVFWLTALGVVLSSLTILWWPRQPQIDALLRPNGWLNAWYGFDLFSVKSGAASDRMIQIFGTFGLLNLVFGVILLARNHVVGWLTVTSVIALSLPCVALPFANGLSTVEYIFMYHRMFFAVPSGLAAIIVAREFDANIFNGLRRMEESWPKSTTAYSLVLVALTCFFVIPADRLHYNRIWHVLELAPHDLAMKPVWLGLEAYDRSLTKHTADALAAAPAPGSLAALQHVNRTVIATYRPYGNTSYPPMHDLMGLTELIRAMPAMTSIIVFPPRNFVTAFSLAGLCSGHWRAQEAPLATSSGTSEFEALAKRAGLQSHPAAAATFFSSKH